MLSFISIPAKIIKFLRSNVSPGETAAGACLGMFLGFVPLNGPMAFILAIFFFIFKINRFSTLLTLPLFKLFYLAGASNFADRIGTYFLIDAKNLENFWRWLTGLPIVAYFDINNTLVIGGLILSTLLSIPVYFAAKKIAVIIFKSKYYEKIRNTKFIAGMNGINPVHQQKPKRINIKGIIILAAILIVFQLIIGLIISPMISSFAVRKINESTSAKIYLERANVWPLTLSFNLKNLKVFNPDNANERIIAIGEASARISPLGLLSKKIVISSIHLNNAEINLQGEPDGSFNIQKLVRPKGFGAKEKPAAAIWDFTKQKQDWFARIYDFLKKRFSKESIEKSKAARNAAKKTAKVVTELPKGKKVDFKSAGANYIFEIKDFNIQKASIQIKAQDGNTVEVDNAGIRLKDIGIDPKNGARVNFCNIFGNIKSSGISAGSLNFIFSEALSDNSPKTIFDFHLQNINLAALRFIYGNSLPVDLANGLLNLQSKSTVINENIDSNNTISLTKHKFAPKTKIDLSKDFMPMPIICEALNNIEPLNLNFKISGTVEKPEFSGFQKSLMELIKPNMKTIKETIKNEGINLLGDFLDKKVLKGQNSGDSNTSQNTEKKVDTKKTINAIKSIFGGGN